MSQQAAAVGGMNAAILVRRLLFFVLLFGLVFFYLVLTFKGLTAADGIDSAQLGREIARGNGFTTKVVRPAAVWQVEQNELKNPGVSGDNLNLDSFTDTYNAPLLPYVYSVALKLVGGTNFDQFQLVEDARTIYRLDRVIAAVCIICFLISLGVNYLLISRIFDVKIAGVTVILMAVCDLMWRFTHTGLPQMLLLLLFSCAMFFMHQALERTIEGRSSLVPVLIAAVFFTLMVLTKWLTIWLVLGAIVYALFTLRPRGVAAIVFVVSLVVGCGFSLFKNYEQTGTFSGAAGLSLYGGIIETEAGIMRTGDPSDDTYAIAYNIKSLLTSTATNFLRQITGLFTNLGSIVAAPLFFLALLHPFKRAAISRFRWGILVVWVMGAIGMAIYGIGTKATSPNQLHILFAPLMAAYGLAFLSIVWSKLDIAAGSGFQRYGHFAIVVLLSAGPFVFSTPKAFKNAVTQGADREYPVWPPYWPPLLSKTLHNSTEEDEIVVSDQPWAVAWYADRISYWLPRRITEFEDIESIAKDQKMSVAGILVTPSSFEDNPLYQVSPFAMQEDFAALILDPVAMGLNKYKGSGLRGQARELSTILARYPEMSPLFPGRIHYYSARPVVR